MARANTLNGAEWMRNSISIWRDIPKDPDARLHPATFPIALAEKLLDCYAADANGLVLDPFAGSGSTLIAAANKRMPALGVDINPQYEPIFDARLKSSLNGTYVKQKSECKYKVADARELSEVVEPNSVEICITSPPYWDIMHARRSADRKNSRPYTNDTNDLGNIPAYGQFLAELGEVFKQVETALRVGGYCIVNVMDLRKKSTFYPLHQDVADTLRRDVGFNLVDIVIWDRQKEYNGMRPLGYPYKFIINKVHEYLLIFRRE